MMAALHRKASSRRKVLLALLLQVAGFAVCDRAVAKEAPAKQSPGSIWQILETLRHQVPFSKEKIETHLAMHLAQVGTAGNDVFLFYGGRGPTTTDGVVLGDVELRIKRSGAHAGILVLRLEGACIGLEQVRSNVGQLEITDTPRGRSLDEETSYTARLSWADVSFGFAERNPRCLATISINPRNP